VKISSFSLMGEGKMRKPPPNVLELPLEVRAEMALKAAVEKLIEEHAREGRSIFIWEDGKVVEVSAAESRAHSTS
jgi:hypothetical protein